MCGIAGIYCPEKRPISDKAIRKMNRALIHRGPDGEGIFVASGIGLGHRRLKIIDLSDDANQPFFSSDGRIVVVFNGEIYNYIELKEQLRAKGRSFRTESDTEVITVLYEEYGEGFVSMLRGMFAIAVYDRDRHEISLFRDRMGIKPLFYSYINEVLYFASEIKAILQNPELERDINYNSLFAFMSFSYVAAPETMFNGVSQVLPAQSIRFGRDGIVKKHYWKPPDPLDIIHGSANKLTRVLDETLFDAVRLHTRCDVPYGAFLSGGLDSSSIVYYMKKKMELDVHTFSAGFKEESFNELDTASATAEFFGTKHIQQIVTPVMDLEFIKKLVWHAEEPTADSSMIPTYMLSKMTAQHVSMCLSGDGADELMAGYDTYSANYIANLYKNIMPSSVRRYLVRQAENMPARMERISLDYKIKQFVRGAELGWREAHFYWRIMFDDGMKGSLFTDRVKDNLSVDSYFQYAEPYFENRRSRLDGMLRSDLLFYLPNDMLIKVDRASMAHSLEVRVPFMDHVLVETVMRMPDNMKLKYFYKKKYLLKQLMKDRLPKDVVFGKKRGFNAPINIWLEKEMRVLAYDVLTDPAFQEIGLFNQSYVEDMLQKHFNREKDSSYQIWCLIFFAIWYEMFITQKNIPAHL